ncbi:hypothetical protein KEM60_00781 [Austwickia sp. TVS 96-490-7B]|uniref:AtpZ/AtpI family protein n=1 Tax=Austwickia sp. TVS 96-490-7B TaxID=2830843 RepID=UPI001C58F7C5|nr:AtpZ/AtpI family protein [Austwickia sp. TVS 96-490-7B]MBW3084593.1 hypothetical protein [Austwickia sp. TVS 96-490-7B]
MNVHSTGHAPIPTSDGHFEAVTRPVADDATTILSYLMSGPLVLGGIGWGLDAWLGTNFLVAIGSLTGIAMSIYVIWLRYGEA